MERRKKGSGCITKLPSGSYRAEIKYTDANGIQQKKQDTAPTQKAAEQLIERFKREIKQEKKAMTPAVSKVTVEYYARNIFIPYKESQHKEDSTVKRLISTMENHIIPAHGGKIFAQLSYVDINTLLADKFEEGLSHSTIKKIHDFYSGMFKLAVARKDIAIDENPMGLVSMIPEKKFDTEEVRFFTYEESQRFIEAALTKYSTTGNYVYKFGPALAFTLCTGIRVSELCALTREEISFEKNIVNINHGVSLEKYYDGNGTKKYRNRIGSVKAPNSVRVFPMSDQAREFAKIALDISNHSSLLISKKDGRVVDPCNVNKQMNAILKRAGIDQCGPHTLRHTFVSALFDKEVDLHTIAALIGDDEATVRKTYLHIFQERKARAIMAQNVAS